MGYGVNPTAIACDVGEKQVVQRLEGRSEVLLPRATPYSLPKGSSLHGRHEWAGIDQGKSREPLGGILDELASPDDDQVQWSPDLVLNDCQPIENLATFCCLGSP
jgi:hypothetical protein